MSSPLNINIDKEWYETESDLSMCAVCDSLIIGKMFQYYIFVMGEAIATKNKVCATCFELKKDDT